ncbi:hypothetical protein D1AOALGA4SA_7568 [Olavius algarvensis Delta 1 endosymbiont]|nr:hypothetical protein D1AOALGA4SA_7568 [Olavius algarvensis Delta 1 endosymbiont]
MKIQARTSFVSSSSSCSKILNRFQYRGRARLKTMCWD